MAKIGYLSMGLKTDLTLDVFGIEKTVKLDYADGMLGMMPVFDSAENALKWNDSQIVAVQITENEPCNSGT